MVICCLVVVAARGKATKITTERVIFNVRLELSRSELEGFEFDGSLDGSCNWQGKEDEQEVGCTDRCEVRLVTAMDGDQTTTKLIHVDGGATCTCSIS